MSGKEILRLKSLRTTVLYEIYSFFLPLSYISSFAGIASFDSSTTCSLQTKRTAWNMAKTITRTLYDCFMVPNAPKLWRLNSVRWVTTYNRKLLKSLHADCYVLKWVYKDLARNTFPFFCWFFIRIFSWKLDLGMRVIVALFLKTTPSVSAGKRISCSHSPSCYWSIAEGCG